MWKPEPLDITDTVSVVAEIVHETIRSYRNATHRIRPDLSPQDCEDIQPWDQATAEQSDAARALVLLVIRNPDQSELRRRADALQTAWGVSHVGIVVAEQVIKALGIAIEPTPECDRTGVGPVQ